MSDDVALKNERQALLSVIIERYRSLRFPKVHPESYYAGQEYVEDSRKVPCTIETALMHPGSIENFEFWHHGAKTSVSQRAGLIVIKVNKKISHRLFDDIRILGIRREFIVGFIAPLIPIINRNLLDQKYNSSNFIIKTFSIYDLMEIFVTSKENRIRIYWPFQMPIVFPVETTLTPTMSNVYVRDYIDACTLFFVGNYDECIRKVITSVENFIKERNWAIKRKSKTQRIIEILLNKKSKDTNSFRAIINHYVALDTDQGNTVNYNLLTVYRVRNRIVHDGFRVSGAGTMFCDKAVSTLYYFFHRFCDDVELQRLVFGVRKHFVLMQRVGGNGLNLDEIERRHRKRKLSDVKTASTFEEYDRHVFGALRIKQTDLADLA